MHKSIYKKIKYKFSTNSNGGLTLVELMVVISIFMIITGVTIFNYGSFRSNVSLQNLTDDIALSIRKAQGYAIGARGVGNNFSNSYGIHFSINSNTSGNSLDGNNKAFLMFFTLSDKDYDNSLTGACGDGTHECMELFNITSTDIVKEIYVDDVKQTTPESSIDIVFIRPDPRAYFCYKSSPTSSCESNVSKISIKISNGQFAEKEKTRIISVQNTGQISIQ